MLNLFNLIHVLAIGFFKKDILHIFWTRILLLSGFIILFKKHISFIFWNRDLRISILTFLVFFSCILLFYSYLTTKLFYDYWTFPSFSVQAAFLFFSRCLADTPTSLNSDKDIISEEEGIDEKEDFNTNPVDGDDDNIIPIKLYTN